jgi:hypothetical protein
MGYSRRGVPKSDDYALLCPMDDFALVAKPVSTPNPVVTRVREPRWIVPPDNLLKANVDGAVNKKYLDGSSSGQR